MICDWHCLCCSCSSLVVYHLSRTTATLIHIHYCDLQVLVGKIYRFHLAVLPSANHRGCCLPFIHTGACMSVPIWLFAVPLGVPYTLPSDIRTAFLLFACTCVTLLPFCLHSSVFMPDLACHVTGKNVVSSLMNTRAVSPYAFVHGGRPHRWLAHDRDYRYLRLNGSTR